MSTKRKMIISVILLIVSIISLFTITYAWIISRVETPSIDGTTTGVKFTYELKDLDKQNYNIKNIAFFDINREEEKQYFSDLATCVELVICNTGSINMTYSIKQIEDSKEEAYIQCIFSTSKIESITDDFSTFIDNNKTLSNQDIEVNSEATIYLYVFGVQPNENSNNSFLDKEYSFSIEIIGEGK